jgi:hypothetical protein
MMTPSQAEDLQHQVETFSGRLEQVQETLRLKGKLLSMEARDTLVDLNGMLERLRRQIRDLEYTAAGIGGGITLQARLGFMDAADALTEKIAAWKVYLNRDPGEGAAGIARQLDHMLDALNSLLERFRN